MFRPDQGTQTLVNSQKGPHKWEKNSSRDYKVLQKLPCFEIEDNPKLSNILNREKSWNDWKLRHNTKKRENCRTVAVCHENLQNFNVLVFKTTHFA